MHDEIRGWLDVLGCPRCRGPLCLAGEALECPPCGHRFPVLGGFRSQFVVSFVRQEDRDRLAAFSQRYREARLREGWRPLSAAQALALPDGSPPGYFPLYWEVRRQSYRALMRILAREGPPPEAGPAVDMGAGTGWLAYRLAQAGYRALAVEASLDADFGLGAAATYRAAVPARLLPVQGDLEHPPLRRGTVSLALLNASLHYAGDLAGTLWRTAETLRPGGCLAILDTPVAHRPQPGRGLGDRHIGRRELHEALLAAGLRPRWIPIRRSWRWWIHQAKAWLKGDARFSFPMVLGYRRREA